MCSFTCLTSSLRAPRRVAMDLCVSLCKKGRVGGGAEEVEKVLLLLLLPIPMPPSSMALSLYFPPPLMDLSRLKAEEGVGAGAVRA